MPTKFSKEQLIDFIILALRWYLAFYMVDYGIGKITSFWEGPREGIYASIKLLNKSGLPVYLAKKDLVKATDEEIVWALLQL